MSKPTFAALERLLLQLGFQARPVSGSHVLFEHAGAGVHVLLRPHSAEEPVEAAVLAYVRRTLNEWNILDREKFDEELRQRSLAG
jgi:predicted RNA binding protein YcfA (HicA-like mRNA interferase family)